MIGAQATCRMELAVPRNPKVAKESMALRESRDPTAPLELRAPREPTGLRDPKVAREGSKGGEGTDSAERVALRKSRPPRERRRGRIQRRRGNQWC